MLILCMDACFRLSNKMRSNYFRDPALGPGWAYLQNSEEYHTHLKNYIDQEEVRAARFLIAIGCSTAFATD